MSVDPDRYRLSDEEHERIFQRRILPAVFAGANPSDRPVAIIFGGQPGAGKSAAVDAAVRDLQARGGGAQIIGDDLRGYHPAYASLMQADDRTAAAYTDRDIGRWVERSIAHARQQRLNIVIEGTMRDAGKVADTMTSLRGAGYEIDARVLAVSGDLSWQGVLQRYEAQRADRGAGRMTTREAHDAGFHGMPRTIERVEQQRLADRVTVYRRGAEVLYNNELQADGTWRAPPAARETVEHERARPMTLAERRAYLAGYERLSEQLATPGRSATEAEQLHVRELRDAARARYDAELIRTAASSEEALRESPRLAPYLRALQSIEQRAERDGLDQVARRVVLERAKQRIAEAIERAPERPVDIAKAETKRAPDLER